MKKLLIAILVLFNLIVPIQMVKAEQIETINTNYAFEGIVKVKYNHLSSEKIKVSVQKGSAKYMYNLLASNQYESFPLQLGNGNYTITVYKNVSGNSYSAVTSKTVEANIASNTLVYLNSVQQVNWEDSNSAIIKAREIAAKYTNDQAKLQAIYNYIISNISYDGNKTVLNTYVPSINDTFSKRSGICYDFSAIFAAMLRSINIPTKLVMGTSSNLVGYHAWNEVYLEGKGWVVIDTSYDSQLKNAGHAVKMIKASSAYTKTKEY